MIVVLDASAALSIAITKNDSKMLKDSLAQADLAIAPDIYPSEITNAFWKYRIYSGVSSSNCEAGIEFCLSLIDEYTDSKSIIREVFAEAVGLKHPAYDIFYLITARRNNAYLLSLDNKLIDAAKKMNVNVFG